MRVLLLFALLGSAFGYLNYPYQYTFDYEGRIVMGIPEIRAKMAGAGIRAKLIVQSIESNTAMAKLVNVEVGEIIEETGCYGNPMGLNINYKPIQGEAKLLEQPFEIHFRNTEGNVMVVTKGEPEWVTDIRKSVAYSLNLQQLQKYNGGNEEVEIFGQEETYFGKCDVSLTVVPPQGLKMGVTYATNYTEVVRAIDFDHCHNRVFLSHASVGNLTQGGFGQFESLQSRSSVGTYRLSNVHGSNYDIQQIIVEGSVSTNPFGFNTEKMVSITNQTFFLRTKESVHDRFVVPSPTKNIRTWQMEVASPYSPSTNPVPWINYYSVNSPDPRYLPILAEAVATGMPITNQLTSQFMSEVDNLIQMAAEELVKEPAMPSEKIEPNPWKYDVGKASYDLDTAVDIVRALTVKQLETLFEKYHQQKSGSEIDRLKPILFVDIMAASGASTSVKVLLEKIRSKDITEARAASIFMTLTHNLVSPTVLDDLMQFVKEQDLAKTPYLASTAWINFASTLNRLCLNPYSWKYAIPHQVFGSKTCKNQKLMDEILPFYKEKLQSAKETWERIVLVQALNNLGSPQTLHIMSNVIRGNYDESIRLKSIALYSLTHSKMVKNARQQVFSILMPIIADQNQQTQLRQVAVFVALTWHPTPAFWQRLCAITWSEKSRDMAAFIYFVTQSYSHSTDPSLERQTQIARFTLTNMKHFTPSFRGTYENFWGSYLPKDHMTSDMNMFWLNNYGEFLPREVYYFLYNSFGGFKTPLFEMNYFSESRFGPVIKIFDELRNINEDTREQMVRDKYHRQAQEVLSIIKDQLNPNLESTEQSFDLSLFLNFFKTMQFYVPINPQFISTVMGNEGTRLLQELINGKYYEFTKFIDPVQVETFMPSEIGLPIFTKVSTPTINMGDCKLQMHVAGSAQPTLRDVVTAKQVTLKIDSNYKFITKTLSSIRALLPWNMKLIATGVDSLKNINLPAIYNLTYSHDENVKNFTLAVVPRINHEFPLIHMHNIPFVLIKRMWPGYLQKDIEFEAIKTVEESHLVDNKYYIDEQYTGVNGYMSWQGDVPFPFTRGYLLSHLAHPERMLKLLSSPTARLWASTVAVNFDKSHTKAFYSSVGFVKPIHSGATPFSQEENRKINNIPISQMYNMVPRLLVNGTQTRYFESIFSYFDNPQHPASSNEFLFGIDVRRSAIPGYDSKTSGFCFDMTTFTPYVPAYEQFMNKLRSQEMEITTSGKISGGTHCGAAEIAQFKGKVSVSDKLEKTLIDELQYNCNADKSDPMLEVDVPAVYDLADIHVQYKESNIPTVFKNYTYNAYDVIRGVASPHSYFNYMYVKNPSEQINIRAERNVPNQRWFINTTLPTENAYFERFWIPYAVEDLLPLGGFHSNGMTQLPRFMVNRQQSGVCAVTPEQEKLTTYDGTYVPFKPSPCYTLLAISKMPRENFNVKVRQSPESDKAEVKVTDPRHGVVIEMKYNEIKVNGSPKQPSEESKTIYTSSGKFFGVIRKFGEFVELRVPGNMTIQITRSNQVLVIPAARLQNSLTGLCGNYNGEPSDDLVEPSGKPVPQNLKEKLPYAWTVKEGQQCRVEKLEQEKRELQRALEENFEQSDRSEGQKKESVECIVYVHPIETYRSSGRKMVCLSKEPVPRCHPGCQERYEETQREEYICFEEDQAPREVIRSLQRGYTKSSVRVQSEIQREFPTRYVKSCRPT